MVMSCPPTRAETMPSGLRVGGGEAFAIENCSSSDDEPEAYDIQVTKSNRAITMPSVSAQELLALFPGFVDQEDETRFPTAFGNPYAVRRGHSKSKVSGRGETMVHLAHQLRNGLFDFASYRERKQAAAAAAAAQQEVYDTQGAPVIPNELFDASNTVILFDWDDTLFPTWFITEVVMPCLPDPQANLPHDSPFVDQLAYHAQAMKAMLEAARAAGLVGIVTLAQRPWVLNSAAKYLPGIDFEEVLQELQIPVIYARECLKPHIVQQAAKEEGICLWTMAKQAAMKKVLKKLYGKAPWCNVLSVGDSVIERDAITEVMWGHENGSGMSPSCKTVKLMEEPSVEQLQAQLMLLSMWISRLAHQASDFDIAMDDSEDTMLQIHSRFAAA